MQDTVKAELAAAAVKLSEIQSQYDAAKVAWNTERAEAEKEAKGEDKSTEDDKAVEEGLKRDEGEKVVLSFGSRKSPPSEKEQSPPTNALKTSATSCVAGPMPPGASARRSSISPCRRRMRCLWKSRSSGFTFNRSSNKPDVLP